MVHLGRVVLGSGVGVKASKYEYFGVKNEEVVCALVLAACLCRSLAVLPCCVWDDPVQAVFFQLKQCTLRVDSSLVTL